MPSGQRATSPLATLAFAVSGGGAGLLLHVYRSSRGFPLFVPPLSLPLTLLVVAAAVLVMALILRRRVTRDTGGNVDPFTAIRILAGARASQFAGGLFAGFGAGLLVPALLRSVAPAASAWAPIAFVAGAGLVLLIAGAIAERLCRVPPSQGDQHDGPTDGSPESGPADQPAFRDSAS